MPGGHWGLRCQVRGSLAAACSNRCLALCGAETTCLTSLVTSGSISTRAGNSAFKTRLDLMVSELGKVQEKLGTGYLSAFPTSWFDRVESLQAVWAPYYTVRRGEGCCRYQPKLNQTKLD